MSSEMREIAREMRMQALDGQTQDWRPNMVALAERIEALAGIGGSVLEEMRSVSPHQDVYGDVVLAWADRLERALLARTEAGADGADMIQWRYTNAETGEVLTPWTECDAAFREKRKDAPGYQFRELFAHPQDASGDAIEAQRYRWLRDEASRAQLEMFADRRGTRLAADRVCDAGIDIAMQAKEAK